MSACAAVAAAAAVDDFVLSRSLVRARQSFSYCCASSVAAAEAEADDAALKHTISLLDCGRFASMQPSVIKSGSIIIIINEHHRLVRWL